MTPETLIDGVEHQGRREDAVKLLAFFRRVTGLEPRVWGGGIIGFGRYHYRYDSGHEGDSMITGFAPRKANMVIYIMPGYDDLSAMLARLGKHRIGKSCLYLGRLSGVDMDVLEEIVRFGMASVKAKYETFDV